VAFSAALVTEELFRGKQGNVAVRVDFSVAMLITPIRPDIEVPIAEDDARPDLSANAVAPGLHRALQS
jgi:hypothetical protein